MLNEIGRVAVRIGVLVVSTALTWQAFELAGKFHESPDIPTEIATWLAIMAVLCGTAVITLGFFIAVGDIIHEHEHTDTTPRKVRRVLWTSDNSKRVLRAFSPNSDPKMRKLRKRVHLSHPGSCPIGSAATYAKSGGAKCLKHIQRFYAELYRRFIAGYVSVQIFLLRRSKFFAFMAPSF